MVQLRYQRLFERFQRGSRSGLARTAPGGPIGINPFMDPWPLVQQ
jgi:hypothetical protein